MFCPAVFATASQDAAAMSQTRRAALTDSSDESNQKGSSAYYVYMLVWTLPTYSFLQFCVFQTLVSYYEDLALYQNLTVLYENLANGVMEA